MKKNNPISFFSTKIFFVSDSLLFLKNIKNKENFFVLFLNLQMLRMRNKIIFKR